MNSNLSLWCRLSLFFFAAATHHAERVRVLKPLSSTRFTRTSRLPFFLFHRLGKASSVTNSCQVRQLLYLT
ncbi:hypothetical protein F4779DRAFT_91677 [Xylariaceae sp. FL0662B]|nr:hypothetical protein F4779DRAFT_91677 [Xylariaceae sp. FL0662B]